MKSKATLRYLRVAPRKVRLVADLIRGKNVSDAKALLKFIPNSSAEHIAKTIGSAVSSAVQYFQADEQNLYIAKIVVEEGPKLKRYRPRARGRAYPIQKKTSHIHVVLGEIIPSMDAGGEKRSTPVVSAERTGEAENATKKQRTGFRPERETGKAKSARVAQRIFRRKAV